MLLCIDAGNSTVKLAMLENGNVVSLLKRETAAGLHARARLSIPRGFINSKEGIDGAVIACVVPALNKILEKEVKRATGLKPVFITSKAHLPFALSVARPGRVGSDRIAAASAVSESSMGTVIIDIGSAITVDLVAGGAFWGGLIMAGPDLALKALNDYTANLPRIRFPSMKALFPATFDDTSAAMLSGTAIGVLGAVKAAVRELEHSRGRTCRKFITGGGAKPFLGKLPSSWKYDPDLVLKGLYRLWMLNRNRF
jgi:pantothenate kinase type III